MRKLFFPLTLGVVGVAILIALCIWQARKVPIKNAIVAEIDARIVADPVVLPEMLDEAADEYLPVVLTAIPVGPELHVLDSGTAAGTGYRVITAAETPGGRRILLDLGLIALEDKDRPRADAEITAIGTLLWPDDRNNSTPDPDRAGNIWFARDLPQMAAELGTEETLVVLRASDPQDPRVTHLPVDSANIKNDHLEYAITWALLAVVWTVMSAYLAVRRLRGDD